MTEPDSSWLMSIVFILSDLTFAMYKVATSTGLSDECQSQQDASQACRDSWGLVLAAAE